MTPTLGRRLSDGMIGAGGVGATVAGVAAMSEPVRRILLDALHGQLPFVVRIPDMHLEHIGRVISDSMGLPIGVQSPLLIFAVTSFCLFLFMFKS